MALDLVVATLTSLKDYAVANPITALVIFFAPGVLSALMVSLLQCLGFKDQGVQRGSYAAKYQSANYGGNIPKGSTFARLQSQAAKKAAKQAAKGR